MNTYEFMDLVQSRLETPLSQSDRERVLSTLRTAGYSDLKSQKDIVSAMKVVSAFLVRKQKAVSAALQTRTAATTGATKEMAFGEIAALNKKGLCGKCKGKMIDVKIADGEEVHYCEKCRVTIWK